MSNPVRRSAPPITDANLAAFEAALGHAIPAEYRAFLLATNGGIPRRAEFRYDFAPGKSRRGRALGFSPLAETWGEIACPVLVPELAAGTLAVGVGDTTVNTGTLRIRVEGDGVGEVLFRPDDTSANKIYPVAASWPAFLDGLKFDDKPEPWDEFIESGDSDALKEWMTARRRKWDGEWITIERKAIEENQSAILDMLVREFRDDFSAADIVGESLAAARLELALKFAAQSSPGSLRDELNRPGPAFWHAPQLIELLLLNGADAAAEDDSGTTPLHHAARAGAAESVKLLLSRGADPTVANGGGETPFAVAEAAGFADVTGVLREALASRPGAGEEPLKPFDLCGVAFARVGKPITLDEIRAAEAELKRDFPPEYRWLLTQANGALFQSRGLLSKGLFPELYERDDEDEPDDEGWEIRMTLSPLRAGDCLHTADDQDASHDAGEEGQFLNYSVSDAAEWYHDGSIMPLHSVPIGGIDGYGCDGTGFLLLGCRGPRRGKLAAFDHGEKPLNITLPELFAKLGQSDSRPQTPGQMLADAVAARDLGAVRAAVAAGGAKNENTRDGRFPLREACQAGFDDAVLAIAEAGERAKVISEALMAGRLAVARQVFDATPKLKRDDLKEMLLDPAIYRDVSFVEAVINRGVKIDTMLAPKRNGYSLSQVAVRSGSVPGLEFLLSRGGNLDSVDFESGATLLHEAAGGYRAEPAMARFLIERGVPRDAGDAGGRTALHLAITAGNAAVAKALIDAGASLDYRAAINSPRMSDPKTQKMLQKMLEEWGNFADELGETMGDDLDAEDAPRLDPADPAAAQALELAGLAGHLQANFAGMLPGVQAKLGGGEQLGQPAADLARTSGNPRVKELVAELRSYAAGK